MYPFDKINGIIFGATGFLGERLAYDLSQKGCTLILHGKSVSKLKKLDNKIKKFNSTPTLIHGDLNNANFYKDLYNSINSRFNQIDFIFNLVGKFPRLSPLTNFSHAEWSELIEININSHWRIIKELEPLLRKSSNPKIIFLDNKNISNGKPFYNIFSISKAMIKILAKIYNLENNRLKIETKVIEIPDLKNGITLVTRGNRKKNLDISKIVKKIINDSFDNK